MAKVCDFCGAPDPTWVYPASDFIVILDGCQIANSRSGWEACEICHALIESGDSKAFDIHCVDSIILANVGLIHNVDWCRQCVLAIHKQFFAHRQGPAQQAEVTLANS